METIRIGTHEFNADPMSDCYGCLGTGFLVWACVARRTVRCSCVDTCHSHESVCDRLEAELEEVTV